MTPSEINTLVIAVSAVLTSLSGYLVYLSHKQAVAIQEVHLSVNSRMDALLDTTAQIAHAQGASGNGGEVAQPTRPLE